MKNVSCFSPSFFEHLIFCPLFGDVFCSVIKNLPKKIRYGWFSIENNPQKIPHKIPPKFPPKKSDCLEHRNKKSPIFSTAPLRSSHRSRATLAAAHPGGASREWEDGMIAILIKYIYI